MTTHARAGEAWGRAISTVADLEGAVGSRPAGAMAKSIPVLDEHCRALLAAAPVAVVGWVDAAGEPRLDVAGGEPGCLDPVSDTALRVPLPVSGVPDGAPAGLCALVPGLNETLRVNGRLRVGADVVLEVAEAFLHCGKCVLRSRLWDGPGAAPTPPGGTAEADGLDGPEVRAFLARSPFALLASTDAAGGHDVSPKGDPAGFVVVLDGRTLALPDRPGNRRTDTFHNLLDDDRLALLALVPGDPRVLHVRGRAAVTADAGLRARMKVRGAVPAAALLVDVADARLRRSPGLDAARLWTRPPHPTPLPRPATVWKDHVALGSSGLTRRLARAMPTRLAEAGLRNDYRTHLY